MYNTGDIVLTPMNRVGTVLFERDGLLYVSLGRTSKEYPVGKCNPYRSVEMPVIEKKNERLITRIAGRNTGHSPSHKFTLSTETE